MFTQTVSILIRYITLWADQKAMLPTASRFISALKTCYAQSLANGRSCQLLTTSLETNRLSTMSIIPPTKKHFPGPLQAHEKSHEQ